MDAASIVPISIQHEPAALELLELQRAAYRVEAERIGFAELPPLLETLEQLRRSDETFLGCRAGRRLVGAVSYRRVGELLDIHRLMVHPDWFRRGVGGALLAQLQRCEPGVRRIVVQTGAANEPALALYRRAGFCTVGHRDVPGLRIACLEKHLPPTESGGPGP
jgi:ribosomal protein S18 acetylase RimI-like enzyme